MLQGLQVLPGVLDSDYTGQIKVMVTISLPSGVVSVKANQRLAQLLLLPLVSTPNPFMASHRDASLPGSSDVYWGPTHI